VRLRRVTTDIERANLGGRRNMNEMMTLTNKQISVKMRVIVHSEDVT